MRQCGTGILENRHHWLATVPSDFNLQIEVSSDSAIMPTCMKEETHNAIHRN
jgi:hypothetical protein